MNTSDYQNIDLNEVVKNAGFYLRDVENGIREFGYSQQEMADSILGIVCCTVLMGNHVTRKKYQFVNELLGLETDYLNFGFLVGQYGDITGKYSRSTFKSYVEPFYSSKKIIGKINMLMLAVASSDGYLPDEALMEMIKMVNKSL